MIWRPNLCVMHVHAMGEAMPRCFAPTGQANSSRLFIIGDSISEGIYEGLMAECRRSYHGRTRCAEHFLFFRADADEEERLLDVTKLVKRANPTPNDVIVINIGAYPAKLISIQPEIVNSECQRVSSTLVRQVEHPAARVARQKAGLTRTQVETYAKASPRKNMFRLGPCQPFERATAIPWR